MDSPAPGGRIHRGLAGIPALIAVLVLVGDQLTKWLVVQTLGPTHDAHRFWILKPVFAIEYVENTGGAFGVLPGQTVLLTVMAVLVIAALVIYYRRVANPSLWLVVSLGLLLGGALGNLLDRVRLGYVVDFISIGPWPKFNVADSAITIGVLLVAWATISGSQPVGGPRPERVAEPVRTERPDAPAASGQAESAHEG